IAGVIHQLKFIESSSISTVYTGKTAILAGRMKILCKYCIAIKMAQSQLTSIPDAQPDPFREFFKPDPLPDSQHEIPDSQESSESIKAPETSRDDRIAIQTALKFKIP